MPPPAFGELELLRALAHQAGHLAGGIGQAFQVAGAALPRDSDAATIIVFLATAYALATLTTIFGAGVMFYGRAGKQEVRELVKASNLRGRGGAGFSCGLKWTLVDRKSGKPVYLIVNADESEPGTFKDRYIMHQDPHQLIEGSMITCWANGVKQAYIYIRGEFPHGARILEKAIAEARKGREEAEKILEEQRKVLGEARKQSVVLFGRADADAQCALQSGCGAEVAHQRAIVDGDAIGEQQRVVAPALEMPAQVGRGALRPRRGRERAGGQGRLVAVREKGPQAEDVVAIDGQ